MPGFQPFFRTSEDYVPTGHFKIPFGKAEVLREGDDITICAWGTQIHVVKEAAQIAAEELDVSVEVIDLGKIYETFMIFRIIYGTQVKVFLFTRS